MITIEGIAPDMIANNIERAFASHPGELLKDELEYRGISQRKFSEQIEVQYSLLNDILNCKKSMSVEFAMLVEAALGINAELLINMQYDYSVFTAKKDKTFTNRLKRVKSVAAAL